MRKRMKTSKIRQGNPIHWLHVGFMTSQHKFQLAFSKFSAEKTSPAKTRDILREKQCAVVVTTSPQAFRKKTVLTVFVIQDECFFLVNGNIFATTLPRVDLDLYWILFFFVIGMFLPKRCESVARIFSNAFCCVDKTKMRLCDIVSGRCALVKSTEKTKEPATMYIQCPSHVRCQSCMDSIYVRDLSFL